MRNALCAALGIMTASAAPAATIRVPEDSPTVPAAVDLAMPGDSVLVGPGTWTDRETRDVPTENGVYPVTACAFPRGGVVIRGAGAGTTILDVQGPGDGIYLSAVFLAQRRGEGALRVEALTVTGVYDDSVNSGVVGLYSDGLEIRDCTFMGNAGLGGSAVSAGECPLSMSGCVIRDNVGVYAIVVVDDTSTEIVACRFEDNVGRCIGTDCFISSCPTTIRDCQFIRNRGAAGDGVGMNLQSTGPVLVEGCLFLENVAETHGGAGIRTSGSYGEIRFNTFAYDSCLSPAVSGAGLRVESGSIACLNNTFVGCYSGLSGAAFGAAFGATGVFSNNVVANSPRPAVRFASGTSYTNSCNLLWMNVSDYDGVAVPAPTDFHADPLFCDLENLDFTVQADSPCLFPPTASCAPVGALGIGCGVISVEPLSFGRIKAMYR